MLNCFAFYRSAEERHFTAEQVELQLWRAVQVLTPAEAQRLGVWRLGLILIVCSALIGCGGRGVVGASSNSPAPTTSNSSPAPTGTPNSSGSGATAVTVSSGQNVTGLNITVAPPTSSTAPNAEDLGANPVGQLGSAANTGGTIQRGTTMRVLLFGTGLSSGMKVTVAGPLDITVGSVQSIKATDGTPGVAFTATVAQNAALGARTVYLKAASGDMTAFTGGLEVVP